MELLLPEPIAFHVDALRTDVGVRLNVSGDVDLATADTLRYRVERVFPGVPILLDLSGVTYLGSIGIAMLIEAKRRGEDLRIVATNRIVDRVLGLVGLDDWF